MGLAVVAAWLYYTVNAVRNLYSVTLALERTTDLRERTHDAELGLNAAEESLDRYISRGEAYDLSRHHTGRTTLQTALGAIRRRGVTEAGRGLLERAEATEQLYGQTSDRTVSSWNPESPAEARSLHDTLVKPAAEKLREVLVELQAHFTNSEALAGERLKDSRDSAATALVLLAALVVAGVIWLLSDVNRRILQPCAAAAEALQNLALGRTPPKLADNRNDEVGALGLNFNRTAELYAERGRTLEERDVESSVNAVLTVAATVNDLKGFGSTVLEKIVEVTRASAAVLYLPEPDGSFTRAASVGGGREEDDSVGREQAQRAARERKPIFLSVDPRTPTVDVYDGRILPRQSAHIPLVYFDHVVGVLALGATETFTRNAQNALAGIAPSLAVALSNAAANERVAEQSRRLSEQNELLEEQRSRIARTAQELARASELKDRFLASVSHELRTPMTVILGFTAALLRGGQGPLTAEQKESLERVHRNAKLLLGLINDVLDISKIESGKMEIARQPVSVPLLLKQIEADYGEAARRKGLVLSSEVAAGLERIEGDPAKLTQILANLVGNALKFTESGSILVRAEPRGSGQWALIVSDTGIGIPPEEQELVFEEFRQGESREHQGRGGTGLGLAITRKLIRAMGGTISLESAPGRGARFTVIFPRHVSGETPLSGRDRSPIPDRASKKSVLIVDDDEGIRRFLRLELESRGLTVVEADNGEKGVALAEEGMPAAILLDVLMPRMDGWETLRRLKNNPATRPIPVIVLSVVENRAYGFSLGVSDYLVKPLASGALFDVLLRAGVLASRGHVLVVDDDPDVRSLLERELVAAGFRARGAAGGAEALAEIERDPPSVVLLDLMMPPPDGFEVLHQLRRDERWKTLPVIVVTAKELTRADYDRLNGSAQRIVRKGEDPNRLVREVLQTVDQSRTGESS